MNGIPKTKPVSVLKQDDMKITLDLADTVFSQYIRLRDRRCLRCGSPVQLNDKGLPVSHENSHYWGRGREGTRYEPDDCITLCFACHKLWGHGDERDAYKDFMIKRLGQRRFDTLEIQAKTYRKKDRKLALIYARELLKSLKADVDNFLPKPK